MPEESLAREWSSVGGAARDGDLPPTEHLPWDFTDTVFRCAWEYPAADFEAEVGFHLSVLGLDALALDEVYALFTTPDREIQFACRRAEGRAGSLAGHRLTLMTRNIESVARELANRLPASEIHRSAGSPVQTVISVNSPSGLTVDIWEDPAPEDEP